MKEFKEIVVALALIGVLLIHSSGEGIELPGRGTESPQEYVEGEVLVKFKKEVTNSTANQILSKYGMTVKESFKQIDVHLVKLPVGMTVEEAINSLRKHPEIEYVEPNYILKVQVNQSIDISEVAAANQIMAEQRQIESNKVQIILYQKGKQTILDNQSPYFQELFHECESLFLTADNGYRLIIDKKRIEKFKKKQTSLEVIYPEVQTGIIRKGLIVYFTRLLIPLSGEFSNGTVFFAGIHEYPLKQESPDLSKRHEYDFIDVYRNINFVLNTRGISNLKEILKKMSIKID